MRCPKCSQNSKRKSSNCCCCDYRFLFTDPKKDGISDHGFGQLLESTLAKCARPTINQFYSHYLQSAQRKNRKPALKVLGGIAIVGFILALSTPWPLFASVLFFFVLTLFYLLGGISLLIPVLKKERFLSLVTKWEGRRGTILVQTDKIVLDFSTPKLEPDLYDYGVEFVLFVDEDRIVDFFIENQLPQERRCLLVSQSMYPFTDLDYLKKLFDEADQLPVALLHGPATNSEEMLRKIQGSLPQVHKKMVIFQGFSKNELAPQTFMKPLLRGFSLSNFPLDAIPYSYLYNLISLPYLLKRVRDEDENFIDSNFVEALDFG